MYKNETPPPRAELTALVEKALKTASKGLSPPAPACLIARLRKMRLSLRGYYLETIEADPSRPTLHAAVEEWLCDNYYVLEKESKQCTRDIRALARRARPGELGRVYALFERVLMDAMPPVADETVAATLNAAGKSLRVTESQFGFAPTAMRAVLLRMAYRACFETHSEEEMRYAVVGLGRLTSIEFDEIIHQCSGVERILLDDPAGVYADMDADSRKYYRHLVAQIAGVSRKTEEEIARALLESCAGEPDTESPRRHIGYPLLHHPLLRGPRLRRGWLTLLAGSLLPLLGAAALGLLTDSVLVGILTVLPLAEILRTPLWHFAISGVDPDFLPRMDPKKIGHKPKTVVLLSTLLPGVKEIPALEDRLRQLYFSNADPDLYYCVLADFKEWERPTDDKDDSQVRAAVKLIAALNRRHGGRFMLFLRGRSYNKTQNKYSGWERKRGAITEFIRYCKGEPTSLRHFEGDQSVLPDIRYLIALDSDTALLYECAQTLICAAMHPLNRPVISKNGVVTQGYGILTPKIGPDLTSARATAFSRVMCGCGGVTAYDTRDKDFYQDLFSESIFAGKGLIVVDAFHELLGDRFPENRILSHDILEGAYLRTACLSDIEMNDTAPTSMSSWLSRLHRWLRGDWQNILFLPPRCRVGGKSRPNPISALSRYKLLDNLRRSLTPPACLFCLLAALWLEGRARLIVALAGLLGVMLPSLWASFFSLLSGGLFTLSRKFFTRTLPHTLELIGQGFFLLVMLPAQSITAMDAMLRSLWRSFISHKKLLEWTTAAAGEARSNSLFALLRRFWHAVLLGGAYLALSVPSALAAVGVCFALFLPLAVFSARRAPEPSAALPASDKEALLSYNAAMWRYYEEFATAEHHWLPPDNVQQSPVFRVAARSSPTNIGMLLLSTLAARDFDLIDTDGLYRRVERVVTAVEGLKTWNGHLYNWYDTQTLDTLKPEFVSTVDCGNFVCCLVALAEGLREFVREKNEMTPLIARIEALIDRGDLTDFYNRRKKLFSIGYDIPAQCLSDSHYDFLMSEARLTSYYAVARKLVSKKHWGALIRTMSRQGSYAGAVSWTGTMFEYFMPHLLLPVFDGSLLGEALTYCLYCQKRRAAGHTRPRGGKPAIRIPWGISESAFYAFDNNLNYQYKAHGVQKLGVKRNLDRELVISPYSSFLTLTLAPNSSMANLRRLYELGVYGRYGFFEAVDFTPERVGAGGLAVTRSHMAHHIGMSMVASCNALLDGRMQKRFMNNHFMRSAQEFLQEKIAKNTVVYDPLKMGEARGEKHERPMLREERRSISPVAPRATLLTNGELTDLLTDTGAGCLVMGDADITRRSVDLVRRAQGVFTLARAGGVTLCATQAPFYDSKAEYSVEYQEESVTYYARRKEAELGVRCLLHPTISCEQRQIALKNTSGKKQAAQVLVYLEPVLSPYRDYAAHPAYSKLFVAAKYDSESKTLIFTRRGRSGARELFLTVGFLQGIDFSFETRREALMSAPRGLEDLRNFYKREFSSPGKSAGELGIPDACCALRFDLTLSPGAQQQATLLLCASRTEAEGLSGILAMRGARMLRENTAAKSPLLGASLEGRLGSALLGELLFPQSHIGATAKLENELGQSGLWSAGISGDLPVALLCVGEAPANAPAGAPAHAQGKNASPPPGAVSLEALRLTLEGYLRLHAILRRVGVQFDLVFLYERGEDRDALCEMVRKCSVPNIIGTSGGVFLLHRQSTPPEVTRLLRAVARHIFPGAPAGGGAAPAFIPAEILSLSPEALPAAPELAVQGGCFAGGRFYVEKSSPLPWCHVLANPSFGTLVSDSALGYTWAVNSRENKLTPWYNDIATDNAGELLLLSHGGRFYNLIQGARASFSHTDARWQGRNGELSSTVTVTVPRKGMAKRVEIHLRNHTEQFQKVMIAYYVEPVMGVSRDAVSSIAARVHDGALLLRNAFNTAVPCTAALVPDSNAGALFTTRRAAFLAGNWGGESTAAANVVPQDDPCAAAIVTVTVGPKEEAVTRFSLSCGRTPQSALRLARFVLAGSEDPAEPVSSKREAPACNAAPYLAPGSVVPHTPDEALNQLISHFLPHQMTASRLWGRTAFYQCGGAYGFRDQLQDAMAYAILDPAPLRRQILRCCAVQFEQGDVLHWWHPLPRQPDGSGIKGVRTRFSDDLLWLPLAVAEYVSKTGDTALLGVGVPYLTADELPEGTQEHYLSPARAKLREDVYSHCLRALRRGYRPGENGLPLIGCGDWCDGFSAVGTGGKGTSVWLAMFLVHVLKSFTPLCEARGEKRAAAELNSWAGRLRRAVDAVAWDGDRYLRAFYDNGEPMGGRGCDECSIDALPQAFAVFSCMPDKKRVAAALESARRELVDSKLHIVRLFREPFRHSAQEPGYVKAYPRGIRENGGQYTHGAIWLALALLRTGQTDEGWELLKMLNPADRVRRPELAERYKLEPYYMPADIYASPTAPGHGGWSIYTGAAAWYFRVVCEELLGLQLAGEVLRVAPRLPSAWDSAFVEATLRETVLRISYRRAEAPSLLVDGAPAEAVPLDGGAHEVVVRFI